MRPENIKQITKENAFYIIALLTVFITFLPIQVSAVVTGTCGDCHTMHNSQDGSAVDSGGPNPYLINAGSSTSICIGCHTNSTNADTIVTLPGGSRVPIVLNTTGYPASPLAGGNFYWVSQGSGGSCPNGGNCDEYGHNVYGISDQDTLITAAEGAPGEDSSCFYTNACHFTLAVEPQTENSDRGGCQGCHYYTYHHVDTGNDKYRFLTGHDTLSRDSITRFVKGIGDPDWEQTPSLANHNIYQGYDGPVVGQQLDDTHAISSFCGGCHMEFHRGTDIGGDSSPWTRHPTDYLLPGAGTEYNGYNPLINYSNLAPVGYTNILSPSRATATVICLSCHRPHGAQQPDMLRWDYDDCQTGTDNADCGCFVCHTTKDAG